MTSSSEANGHRPADPRLPQNVGRRTEPGFFRESGGRRGSPTCTEAPRAATISQLDHLAQPSTGLSLCGQFIRRPEEVAALPVTPSIEYVMADKVVEVIEP